MKCFNHHQIEAVGICIKCNKGLCPECAEDTETGLYCKGKCEEPKRSKIQQKGRRALLFAIFGIVYILLAYPYGDEALKARHIYFAAAVAFFFMSIESFCSWIKLQINAFVAKLKRGNMVS